MPSRGARGQHEIRSKCPGGDRHWVFHLLAGVPADAATALELRPRPFGVVQHEAAHVVVGVALGLRLRSAAVVKWTDEDGTVASGWTWFPEGSREALALMYAAGIAWERATGGRKNESGDSRCLRELIGTSRQGFEACVTAAAALLESRSVAHARVTRLLLERDITGEDVTAIAHGARRPQPEE